MRTLRAQVTVSGLVQGVFFRHFTKQQAEELGLSGWVQNLPDERVEAVFEGPKEKIKEMIAWCRQGSPGARVRDVTVSWQEPEGLKSFEVTASRPLP